jgi:hypothetical protein
MYVRVNTIILPFILQDIGAENIMQDISLHETIVKKKKKKKKKKNE